MLCKSLARSKCIDYLTQILKEVSRPALTLSNSLAFQLLSLSEPIARAAANLFSVAKDKYITHIKLPPSERTAVKQMW